MLVGFVPLHIRKRRSTRPPRYEARRRSAAIAYACRCRILVASCGSTYRARHLEGRPEASLGARARLWRIFVEPRSEVVRALASGTGRRRLKGRKALSAMWV